MELADKLAHLGRGGILSRMGRKCLGVFARARRMTSRVALSLFCAFMLVGGFVVAIGLSGGPAASRLTSEKVTPTTAPTTMLGNGARIAGATAVNLPAATTPPVAAPATVINAPTLADRENFAFVPYWSLPQSANFSLTGLSTLDYFSLGVNSNGTFDESGPGWNGLQSQALSSLITRAHAAGERVVLTVNDFDQSSLDALTSSPTAPTTLATALIPMLQAKTFDGVDFDLEGTGDQDQAGLTHLISVVSTALRAADPHWQITMDTYASAAGDQTGFYNIPALAPYVDAFFVMAYELNLQGQPNSVSPLTSGMFSDLTMVQQYEAVVPANKIIIGTPFFGIDWPTSNGTLTAAATGPATDIADASVAATDPTYWDPVTSTGWTSYQVGTQWHESFFENPFSLYMVSELASHFGVRGVGIWALGMANDEPAMVLAMDGYAPAGSPGSNGPNATSTSPPVTSPSAPTTTPSTVAPLKSSAPAANVGPTSTTAPVATTTTTGPYITGSWLGMTRPLTPVGAGSVDMGLTFAPITNFSTNIPAYTCLNGKTLTVYLYGSLTSGTYVAVASTPTDCVNQDFAFPS